MKTPWWFMHKTPTAIILLPVSWIYYFISRAVYCVRGWNAYKSHRPVICVGNILAGGVGKTPIVRAIATYFDAPIVMRGYKKSAKTGNIGDEATMLSRSGLIVHTGDRKSNVMLRWCLMNQLVMEMDFYYQPDRCGNQKNMQRMLMRL